MSLLIPSGETLMEWREPNAYSRKDLSHGGWIGLLIVVMIPPLLLIIDVVNHGFSRGRIMLALIFLVIGIAIFIRGWFGPGDVVCLKEDCVTKATSRPPRRTLYKNIECCDVRHDSYNDIKFSVLKFTMRKGLPVGQVDTVAVPGGVYLDQILHIFSEIRESKLLKHHCPLSLA